MKLFLLVLFTSALLGSAQMQTAIPLWPGGAPGALGTTSNDIPTLTPYLPDPAFATGAAMVICPGGGYVGLAPHEGNDYALWLNQHGVAGFVLRSRLGPAYHHPAMLQDAARAVRLVRARAADWQIDTNRVGIMGSSAGGHLASTLLTHFDSGNTNADDPIERQSSKPDIGILCYAVSWSHALSAFSVSLFLWYWDRTQLRRTLGQWVILGLMAGLMGNVYYPNILLLIFPGLEMVFLTRSRRRDPSGAITIGKLISYSAAFVAALLVSLLPTFLTRQIIYGSPLAAGYPGIGTWHWTSPLLLRVLFSADHGMWSWTPILFLAAVGLFFLPRRNALLGTASIVTFLAYYYFIASYPDWDGLSSYGNRFFISLTPIFILALAALLQAFSEVVGKTSRAMAVAIVVIALLTIWNAEFIFQWGTHMVPARGEISWPEMVHNQFVVVPVRLERNLDAYFFHRRDMMQHIEQEDIEQQQILRQR